MDCSFYPINHFLEFQIPYLPFFLNPNLLTYNLCSYKKIGLQLNLRRSFRLHAPPSSQITGQMDKAPIQILFLSLLIGFGGGREHECQLLHFQCHIVHMYICCLLSKVWEIIHVYVICVYIYNFHYDVYVMNHFPTSLSRIGGSTLVWGPGYF